jgi:glucokinase
VILAGDVGGTKTHLALFAEGANVREPSFQRLYPSHEHASLEALVSEFLAGAAGARVTRAAFGVAGVVTRNHCETTNLPWHVDGAELSRELGGASVRLMNDLAATAAGLDSLGDADLDRLQAGSPEPGTRAVIAAGTGLGMVASVGAGAGATIVASEGGHADFAPGRATEDGLCAWLRARYGRTSAERVLSGRGLADLYRYLTEAGRGAEPAGFAARFAAAEDPAAVVSEGALDGSCARARLALEMFVEAYGSEAGNLALRVLPVAGLFIGGGIAPRIRSWFHDPRFLGAFRDKPPMTELLARIPVTLILEPAAALWGAAHVALTMNGAAS